MLSSPSKYLAELRALKNLAIKRPNSSPAYFSIKFNKIQNKTRGFKMPEKN